MSAELGELKLQLERLAFEKKEASITMDAIREQAAELSSELEEQKVRAFSSAQLGFH